HAGMAEEDARSRLWLIDIKGLLIDSRTDLEPYQRKYAQPVGRLSEWNLESPSRISLADVIGNVRPSVLIGVSAQSGAFDEGVVRLMADYCERPIIFPLSNPTPKSEATPSDLIEWTGGRALVATGSPFPPVTYDGRVIQIGQCNNALIFPLMVLGVIASRARRVTDTMFAAAADTPAQA